MNLLFDDFPSCVIDVNGTLYFDTDDLSPEDYSFQGDTITYEIYADYKTAINIMMMYEGARLTGHEKALCMLKMFYKDIPSDIAKAHEKAMSFLNCGETAKEQAKSAANRGRLWTWEQDGNYIYAAINYSHNDILKREPNLHWWEFLNKFMQLKEDCKFNEIVANRLAYKKGKLTKEQKTARQEYPEIYVLKADRKTDDMTAAKLKEMERMLNS